MKQELSPAAMIVLAGAMAADGGLFYRPARAEANRQEERCCEEALEFDRPQLRQLARVLGLTAAQERQIQTILAAEGKTTRLLQRQLRQFHCQLRETAIAVPFDEAAVRTLAGRQATTLAELAVCRARIANGIFSLLTTAQQALARQLRPFFTEPAGHGAFAS